jgi:hypothetical protein
MQQRRNLSLSLIPSTPRIRQSCAQLALKIAAFAMMLSGCLAAAHATTLNLDDNSTIEFRDGSVDAATGSGQLIDVILIEGGEVVLRAEQVDLLAEGALGEADWLIRDLTAKNVEFPEESIFVGELVIREFAAGAVSSGNIPDDVSLIFGEGARVQIATRPLRYGALADGTVIITKAGAAISGLSVMPVAGSGGDDAFMKQLRARGMDAIIFDIQIDAVSRIVGPHLEMSYQVAADIRGLGGFQFDMGMRVNSALYAQILPLLNSPDQNTAAFLSLSSAVSLTNAGLVVNDTGIGDILMEISADEQGVRPADMRTTTRLLLADSVRGTFPQNASWLLPPLDALLKAAGRLDVRVAPPAPVPFSSMIGFMMLPDMALDQLGVNVTHRPR